MMFNGKLKAEIASLKAQVNALVVSNTEKDAALTEMQRIREANETLRRWLDEERKAHKAAAAERDALRDAAAAKRAKQLANLRNQKRAA